MHDFFNRAFVCLVIFGLFGCATEQRESSWDDPPQIAATSEYTETIQGTTITFDMVWVPCNDIPDLDGFWIGKTEVTWDEYLAYCGFALEEPIPPGADAVSRPSKPLETFPFDRGWGKGRRPALGMSWNAAKTYCEWLSGNTGYTYRLPTEAEWSAACGDGPFEPLGEYAWFAANSGEMTHEVGRKNPNTLGIHDMLGNVMEYCGNPYSGEKKSLAAIRGGSWADQAEAVTPDHRVQFQRLWVLADPNVPPGVWWVPDGEKIGFRVLRPGPADSP